MADDTCSHPKRVNYITYLNPSSFRAGPRDFFYGGTGPCSTGIDVSPIG